MALLLSDIVAGRKVRFVEDYGPSKLATYVIYENGGRHYILVTEWERPLVRLFGAILTILELVQESKPLKLSDVEVGQFIVCGEYNRDQNTYAQPVFRVQKDVGGIFIIHNGKKDYLHDLCDDDDILNFTIITEKENKTTNSIYGISGARDQSVGFLCVYSDNFIIASHSNYESINLSLDCKSETGETYCILINRSLLTELAGIVSLAEKVIS